MIISFQRFVVLPAVLAVTILVAMPALAQQVPLPRTPAEVTAPAQGVIIPPEYAKSMGGLAYIWDWPLVIMVNR
jgi:hypothetical protein